jgi:CBS domain containing-hemolysin-like protein
VSLSVALSLVPILIALNAFFVVSEYAVVASRPAQVAALIAKGRRRAAGAMKKLQADPAGAIGAIQVCITMSNLLLGWIGEPAMSTALDRLLGPIERVAPRLFHALSLTLSFIVVTFLTVVFSELLPKAMTLRYLDAAATVSAVPILAVRRALYPLVRLMNATANLVTRPLGLGRVETLEAQAVSADELRLMAIRAAEDGVVTPRERALVLNSLAIGRRPAKQIMVPRMRIAHLDLKQTMDENLRVTEQHLFSRLPLCDGGMDNVVGVVLTREFLTAYHAGGDASVLSLIAQPPVFLPEFLSLDKLIETFQREQTQMIFLVDEYGGVEGVVTLRDVMDELFRESSDSRTDPALSPR